MDVKEKDKIFFCKILIYSGISNLGSNGIRAKVNTFFFIFVAAPKGVQGYVFIGLNQFTYHHRSNRSRWPGLVQLGAPPSPRLESQLLAVIGGRGVVVKMKAL